MADRVKSMNAVVQSAAIKKDVKGVRKIYCAVTPGKEQLVTL